MSFCTRHSKNLDEAFKSLSLKDEDSSAGLDRTASPTDPDPALGRPGTFTPGNENNGDPKPGDPSSELFTILLALRKLREALLASSSAGVSAPFAQRVHVFNVRVALLAFHPPSFHPSLLHLLATLHTPQHPLPKSELAEMVSYLILDLACRQDDVAQAYAIQSHSRENFGYENTYVEQILKSIVTNNWVSFWRVRRKVDGYVRAILHWKIAWLRKNCLKAIGRTYMSCDISWILESATGGEMSWEELVEKEDVGWIREGDRVIIRKPKRKT